MKLFKCKACEAIRGEVTHLREQNAKLTDKVIALSNPDASRMLLAREMPTDNSKSELMAVSYNNFGEPVLNEYA